MADEEFDFSAGMREIASGTAGEGDPAELMEDAHVEADDEVSEEEPVDFGERFDDFDSRLSSMQQGAQQREELLLRHIQHLTEQAAPSAPEAPDAETQPISRVQHDIGQLSERLDSISESLTGQATADEERAYVEGLTDWIGATEDSVQDENSPHYEPDYLEARQFFYERQMESWAYANPGQTEAQVTNGVQNWFLQWSDTQRKNGNFLPNVVWNWAVDLGYTQAAVEEGAGNVEDFNERREAMESLQVPDIGTGGGGHEPEAYEPQEIDDFQGMDQEAYNAFLESQGGLTGALRRLRGLAGTAG